MSDPFIGEIRTFGFSFAPRNWATCSGQVLAISQYTTLFSLLGTIYGGDGRTSFNLPDLRGRAPISFGQAPGLQHYNQGTKGGYEGVLLTDTTMPTHSHTATPSLESTQPATNAAGNISSPGGNSPAEYTVSGGRSPENLYSNTSDTNLKTGTVSGTIAVSDTGGSQAHENRMPFLPLNFCIAMEGIYPSRS